MRKLFMLLLLLPLAGCQKETPAPKKTEQKKEAVKQSKNIEKNRAKAAAKVAAKPAPKNLLKEPGDLEKKEYKLSFNLPKTVNMNQPFQFSVIAQSKGEYHINKEYPFSLKIKKGDKVLGKDRFKKQDVKLLDDNKIEFDIKGVCKHKGDHKLDGVFTFGYCTETLCATAKQHFTFDVTVQ